MRSRPTLSTKLLAMGAGFLLVALASIGLTLWVTWKLEGGAAAVVRQTGENVLRHDELVRPVGNG